MRKRTLAAALSTGLVAGLVVAVPMTVANAAGTTNVVVHPSDLNSGGAWSVAQQSTAGGWIAPGPGTPTLGDGSFHVMTGPGQAASPTGGKVFLLNSTDANKPLGSLTALSYDFYRSSASAAPSAATSRTAINIGVNFSVGGASKWTTLVYEPYYDTAVTLADDTWQHGDAFSSSARWWSTRALPGVCGAAPDPVSCPDTFVPWAQVESALDALGGGTIDASGIQFATGQNSSGGPWSNYVGAVDNIHIADATSDNTYDFEYWAVPAALGGLTASKVASNAFTLTWNSSAAAASYTVQVGNATSTVTGTSKTITGLSPNTKYQVVVTPRNPGYLGNPAFLTVTTSNAMALTMAMAPRVVVFGHLTVASGVVKKNGTGVSGVTVTLSRAVGKSWVPFSSVKTAANGTWAKAFLPSATWTIRATSAGFPAATGVVTVTSRVNIKAIGRTVYVGVAPNLAGKKVLLQRHVGAGWVTDASATLSRTSTTWFRASRAGVYRVVAPAVPGYATGVSTYFLVR